jgi:hypothetical protein
LKPYVLILALAGLAACEQGKPRHPPPDPMAIAPPEPAAAPTAPAAPAAAPGATASAPLSEGLSKRPEAAGFFLDHAGAAADPRSRQPAVTPADQPAVFDGFAFDAVAKLPARGVDVVVDGKAYPAAYGAARPDVARYFKAPALINVGFKATLPAQAMTAGMHLAQVRVVAADGKGYFDSPAVSFSAR